MIVGVGVDIVDVGRIRGLIHRWGDRFAGRVLTDRERAYCSRRHDPAPSIAARFAAKEAVLKALGIGLSGGVRWGDIEVVRGEWGPPTVELAGGAGRIAAERGVVRAHLSLTHDGGAAMALVVLEGPA